MQIKKLFIEDFGNFINEWIHMVIVQDGLGVKVYLNGKEYKELHYFSSSNIRAWFDNYPNLDNGRIGCSNYNKAGDTIFYDGVIADFRYYRKALSPSEVEGIYNQGLSHNLN